MKKIAVFLTMVCALSANAVYGQTEQKPKKEQADGKAANAPKIAVAKNSAPLDLAKTALAAHCGEKYKTMKTLVVRGTVDISGSPTQVFPGTFATVFSGEKYRLEINSLQSLKQTFDGQRTVSSIQGFELPPLNRLGLPLLTKIGEKDFIVSALPDTSKKKNGFRITSPEGFYTDFFVDEKTGMVKSYESSYEFGERTITTSVEIDKVRDVDGIKVPERYAQRFETGQLTIYADFKAKEILVNSAVADDVFTSGK